MSLIADDCIHHIFGSPLSNVAWTAAIVLQGPYLKDITRTCIEIFSQRNENILIVVSTYFPEGVSDAQSFLSEHEMSLVKSGLLVFLFLKKPGIDRHSFWETNQHNQNMQRLSSFAGVRYAHEQGIEFSLKSRSDRFLGRQDVIAWLRRQIEVEYPLIQKTDFHVEIKGRITVPAPGTFCEPAFHEFPFYVRDDYYFGHTTDLMRFFDMTARSGWNEGRGMKIAHPESALTVRWIEDMGISVSGTKELAARYLILVDTDFVEAGRLEGDPCGRNWIFDLPRYLREGVSYVRELHKVHLAGFRASRPHSFLMTHALWKRFYREVQVSTITSQPPEASSRIAFVVPLDATKHLTWARHLSRLSSDVSDVYIILSRQSDLGLWASSLPPQECRVLVMTDWVPEEALSIVEKSSSVPTFKKWMGLSRIMSLNKGYSFLITIDCEINVLRSIDEEFVRKIPSQFTFIGDHIKSYSDHYSKIVRTSAMRGATSHVDPGNCHDVILTSRSGLPVYSTETIQQFFNFIGVDKPLELARTLDRWTFDHVVYQHFLVDRVMHGAKFLCLTHELHATVGWSLECSREKSPFEAARRAGLSILWLSQKTRSVCPEAAPEAYIEYHMDQI